MNPEQPFSPATVEDSGPDQPGLLVHLDHLVAQANTCTCYPLWAGQCGLREDGTWVTDDPLTHVMRLASEAELGHELVAHGPELARRLQAVMLGRFRTHDPSAPDAQPQTTTTTSLKTLNEVIDCLHGLPLEYMSPEETRLILDFLRELQVYREGGITEEILRRNDGYIKVGHHCAITLRNSPTDQHEQ